MLTLFAQTVDVATNPAIGVLIFVLGGLAGAVFYLPFKKVKNWAWESSWMGWSLCALVVVPWVLAMVVSPNIFSVLKAAPSKELGYCAFCGALWGFSALTWGLMIRYLGVGLGLAIGCGLCSAAGTLVPPVIKPVLQSFVAGSTSTPLGDAIVEGVKGLYGTPSANVSLLAVLASLVGIVLVGSAGMSKENELSAEVKKAAVAEYNFRLGLLVAIFSGLTGAVMSFGLHGGTTMESLARSIAPVTSETWKAVPSLVVVLMGGLATNAGWCLLLNVKNRTASDYWKADAPRFGNLFFAGLGGAIWCLGPICVIGGEPAMGKLAYISWAMLMGSTILFSTVLGIALGEWRNTSSRTRWLLAIGLVMLVASAATSALSGYLKQ